MRSNNNINIKTDPDIISSYLEDTSNLKGGYAIEVALPSDIEELSDIVKYANSKKIPVTISGGGTGTTGSRIPFGGIVISTEKFNRILGISREEMSTVIQSGVLVEELKSGCEKEGLFYTSHPTEKAATIGGTVSTNASGARSFKYGPTRKYVRGLKMVLANGDILDIKRGERVLTRRDSKIKLTGGREIEIPLPTYKMPDVKNSAGYFARDGMDLIDLFIGQEGTLSVIYQIDLALERMPSDILSSFIFFKDESDAWSFARDAKTIFRSTLLSIEYFDSNALRLLRIKNSNVPADMKAAIFFEEEADSKKEEISMDKWLELVSRHNTSPDHTWVAMNEDDAEKFINFRYAIPEAINDAIRGYGFQKFSTDIAVPEAKFLEMMIFYVDTFKVEKLEHVIFGHIGENHLHVNILPRSEAEQALAREITSRFIKKGVFLGGTVSAEHGIGKIKHKYLEEMYCKSGILEMARIKKELDPNWILGLDNIFPKEIVKLI